MNLRETIVGSLSRAVIVAHPDDETLWFGGLLIANPGPWTVICCSIPRRDPIRAWKFHDACARLGATPRLMPAPEPAPDDPNMAAFAVVDVPAFDVIVTHGEKGEYGHVHHKAVHRFVVDNARGAVITSGDGEVLRLDREQSARKRHALEAYDHVLPYEPLGSVPKHEALLHRYGDHHLQAEGYAIAR